MKRQSQKATRGHVSHSTPSPALYILDPWRGPHQSKQFFPAKSS